MKADLLAQILKHMYETASEGETATMVHLFGIKYAGEIDASGASPKDIAIMAGISDNYGTEINKGRNLAKYVIAK